MAEEDALCRNQPMILRRRIPNGNVKKPLLSVSSLNLGLVIGHVLSERPLTNKGDIYETLLLQVKN